MFLCNTALVLYSKYLIYLLCIYAIHIIYVLLYQYIAKTLVRKWKLVFKVNFYSRIRFFTFINYRYLSQHNIHSIGTSVSIIRCYKINRSKWPTILNSEWECEVICAYMINNLCKYLYWLFSWQKKHFLNSRKVIENDNYYLINYYCLCRQIL